jgi:DNA-binding CsgD family transcriptional regulator
MRVSLAHPPAAPPTDHYYQPNNLTAMWKVWFVIVVASFVLSIPVEILQGPVNGDTRFVNLIVTSIIPMMLFGGTMWWMLGQSHMVDFASIWRIVFFVVALALTIMAIDSQSDVLQMVLSSAWKVLVPIVWITACDIARHTNANAYVITGIGLGSYSLASAIGGLAYPDISGIVSTSTLCVMLLFVLFVTLGVCLGARDPNTQRIFEDLHDAKPPIAEFATIDERCMVLGSAHGLTAREIEIMKMIGKGRSRAYIAETLFITENTVKTHVGHIYAKLDIHQKKELQQLIDK